MSAHADFSVDLDALSALQSELSKLIVAVDDLTTLGPVDHAAIGDESVADAIDRFVSRWRTGRLDVVAHLSSCDEIVKLAIDGYGQTDGQLRSALETTEAQP